MDLAMDIVVSCLHTATALLLTHDWVDVLASNAKAMVMVAAAAAAAAAAVVVVE